MSLGKFVAAFRSLSKDFFLSLCQSHACVYRGMEIARVTFDKDFFLPRRISLHALVQKAERV